MKDRGSDDNTINTYRHFDDVINISSNAKFKFYKKGDHAMVSSQYTSRTSRFELDYSWETNWYSIQSGN